MIKLVFLIACFLIAQANGESLLSRNREGKTHKNSKIKESETIYSRDFFVAQPPKGWDCIDDPAQLPQKIKKIYIGKGTSHNPFNPSLNLACEHTELPLEDYVKMAKSYHESQRDTRCTCLGQIQTEAGMAELLQIDRVSQWGAIRFIQAMLIKNEEAFVLTATCLKEDFSALSSQLFKAIQSFTMR